MNLIRYWSIVICTASIIYVVIELLMPSGKMEKTIKMVLNIFWLCIAITSICEQSKNFKFKIEIDNTPVIQKGKKFLSDINTQLEETAKYNIKSIIYDNLKDKNIYPEKIEIIMDTNKANSISINKCEIYINQNDYFESKDMIKNYVQDNLKIVTEVYKN